VNKVIRGWLIGAPQPILGRYHTPTPSLRVYPRYPRSTRIGRMYPFVYHTYAGWVMVGLLGVFFSGRRIKNFVR